MKYVIAALIATVLVVAGVMAGRQLGKNESPNSPAASQPTTAPASAVMVYFTRAESQKDPERVFSVGRSVPTGSDAKETALAQLVAGPTDTERSMGYGSDVILDRERESNCDGKDFTLKVDKGTATLQFCRQLEHLGSMSDARSESQIKATLEQFSEVKKVVILNDQGKCEFDLAGRNLCLEK